MASPIPDAAPDPNQLDMRRTKLEFTGHNDNLLLQDMEILLIDSKGGHDVSRVSSTKNAGKRMFQM